MAYTALYCREVTCGGMCVQGVLSRQGRHVDQSDGSKYPNFQCSIPAGKEQATRIARSRPKPPPTALFGRCVLMIDRPRTPIYLQHLLSHRTATLPFDLRYRGVVGSVSTIAPFTILPSSSGGEIAQSHLSLDCFVVLAAYRIVPSQMAHSPRQASMLLVSPSSSPVSRLQNRCSVSSADALERVMSSFSIFFWLHNQTRGQSFSHDVVDDSSAGLSPCWGGEGATSAWLWKGDRGQGGPYVPAHALVLLDRPVQRHCHMRSSRRCDM